MLTLGRFDVNISYASKPKPVLGRRLLLGRFVTYISYPNRNFKVLLKLRLSSMGVQFSERELNNGQIMMIQQV
jgi:hypothetical protein